MTETGETVPRHRTNHVEDLEQHCLRDGRIKLADVKRSTGRCASALGRKGGGGRNRRRHGNDRLGSLDGLRNINSSGRHVFRFFWIWIEKLGFFREKLSGVVTALMNFSATAKPVERGVKCKVKRGAYTGGVTRQPLVDKKGFLYFLSAFWLQ